MGNLGSFTFLGQTTGVKTFAPILIVLALTSIYGLWYRTSRGKIRSGKHAGLHAGLSRALQSQELGARATFVQFSSAFCTPCRATRTLLQSVVSDFPDLRHIEIDAEAHLELVRELGIHSTPTTLILDARGSEVGRAVGAPKRDQVLLALSAIV